MTKDISAGVDRRDDGALCWSCNQPVDQRAMFCHACGALQPPRGENAFARLGLAHRFDLDPTSLDRQHAGFRARLAPERLAGRRPEERIHAACHRDALDQARGLLADPWQRSLHLLALAGRPLGAQVERDLSPEASAARATLAEAAKPAEIEPVIQEAAERMELLFVELAAAFRGERLDQARDLTEEIGRLRRLITEARLRRAELGGR